MSPGGGDSLKGFPKDALTDSQDRLSRFTRALDGPYQEPLPPLLGFNRVETDSSNALHNTASQRYSSLEADLFKLINKKLLKMYCSSGEATQIVSSKYWPCQKIADEFPTEYKVKFEAGTLDREHAIIAQIHQLNKELAELRKMKQLASEQLKLQTSPFFQVKKELRLPRFVPPKSPHHLLEEELYSDPWSMLVATIFLNKTTARAARPYVFWFLEDHPNPFKVVTRNADELESYFGFLGLQKTRAKQVWRMSYDFLHKDWNKVGELYGIGKYGEDAFRMFCLGDFSVEPQDRYLRIYKAWYLKQEREARLKEMNS